MKPLLLQTATGYDYNQLLNLTEAHHRALCESQGIEYQRIGEIRPSWLPKAWRWNTVHFTTFASFIQDQPDGRIVAGMEADMVWVKPAAMRAACETAGLFDPINGVRHDIAYVGDTRWASAGFITVRVSQKLKTCLQDILENGPLEAGQDSSAVLAKFTHERLSVIHLDARWNFYAMYGSAPVKQRVPESEAIILHFPGQPLDIRRERIKLALRSIQSEKVKV